jgi:hypothetical protein
MVPAKAAIARGISETSRKCKREKGCRGLMNIHNHHAMRLPAASAPPPLQAGRRRCCEQAPPACLHATEARRSALQRPAQFFSHTGPQHGLSSPSPTQRGGCYHLWRLQLLTGCARAPSCPRMATLGVHGSGLGPGPSPGPSRSDAAAHQQAVKAVEKRRAPRQGGRRSRPTIEATKSGKRHYYRTTGGGVIGPRRGHGRCERRGAA